MTTIDFDQRTGTAAKWTELAYRGGDGLDVTLMWRRHRHAHRVRVCVCDRRDGAYFEVEPDPGRALEVFYHPFAYRGLSTVDYADARLAA